MPKFKHIAIRLVSNVVKFVSPQACSYDWYRSPSIIFNTIFCILSILVLSPSVNCGWKTGHAVSSIDLINEM